MLSRLGRCTTWARPLLHYHSRIHKQSLGADHLTLEGGGVWFLVIKNFFSSNMVGRIFFPFFSHKLSITFVLHAIFFFRQALAGNFFSKSPTPPPPQESNGRPLKSCIVNTKDVQLRQVFACDLRHERYRLNQTFDTCKWEHVSCLAACYKLTTPATSRKEFAGTVGNIPQALQLPSQRWMTTLRSLGCKLIACNKNCRFRILQKADNCHKLG